jgi:hypothetical protein
MNIEYPEANLKLAFCPVLNCFGPNDSTSDNSVIKPYSE